MIQTIVQQFMEKYNFSPYGKDFSEQLLLKHKGTIADVVFPT